MARNRGKITSTKSPTVKTLNANFDDLPVINEFVSHKTSRYKNVYWKADKQKWKANIMRDRTAYFLGYFKSEEEAHQAVLDFDFKIYAIKKATKQAQKSSRYTGVYYRKSRGKWVAKYSNVHLGTFNTEAEAFAARKRYTP